MNLINLNDVQSEMVAEFDSDVSADDLYLSPRLTVEGAAEYPDLLRRALLNGDDATIVAAIGTPGRLNTHETARHPKGGPDIVKEVPITASQTMGEAEFNRFYARAVCVHAIDAAGPNATVDLPCPPIGEPTRRVGGPRRHHDLGDKVARRPSRQHWGPDRARSGQPKLRNERSPVAISVAEVGEDDRFVRS